MAQWKDVLIAVHKLPDDDWMGFTHAYFPTYAFEETIFKDGWAFARKGDGYLAITAPADRAINATDGYRELRCWKKTSGLSHGTQSQDQSHNF
jgi:hypothetical protein